MTRPTAEQRFWKGVDRGAADECWIWKRSARAGYGQFTWSGGSLAHRFAYEQFVGLIPEGLHLDHLCRTPLCVNPAHLEPVTCRENTLRGIGPSARFAKATHCVHGHPFDEKNTRWRPGKGRSCRECARIAARVKNNSWLPAASERTHCPQGHPYDEENTYINPRGSRECRICRKERLLRFKAKAKAGRLVWADNDDGTLVELGVAEAS
ncbi:MAG TPA: HNH endonuclease signature motif containing protein [Acidimicrobiales bacterium]|nr:HNH endonuclease signature motif containing protein [Acidimicrobiales bacterium]